MFISCNIWTVARTNQGTAVLLRDRNTQKSLPLFVTPLEAQMILSNLGERTEGKSFLYNFIFELCDGAALFVKRIELTGQSSKEMVAHVRIGRSGDDFTIDLNPPEAVALAAQFSCPVEVENELFNQHGIKINLIEIEKTEKKRKLEEKLDQLVANEFYEEAAVIRDKITNLSKLGKSAEL